MQIKIIARFYFTFSLLFFFLHDYLKFKVRFNCPVIPPSGSARALRQHHCNIQSNNLLHVFQIVYLCFPIAVKVHEWGYHSFDVSILLVDFHVLLAPRNLLLVAVERDSFLPVSCAGYTLLELFY